MHGVAATATGECFTGHLRYHTRQEAVNGADSEEERLLQQLELQVDVDKPEGREGIVSAVRVRM
jgi:hypothetical protein